MAPAPWNLNVDGVARSVGPKVLMVEPFAGVIGVGAVTFSVSPAPPAFAASTLPPGVGDTGFELCSPEPQATAVASATAAPQRYNFLNISDSVWMRIF